MFEPVKKLTVHLAEQLVRGELAQSPQTISRLVDNSLRELNASGEKAVIVHLNPEDLEAYRPLVAQFSDSMILRPDSLLERGSVRVSLDGSVVEDLMQRRVDGLKKSLNQPAAPGWQAGGSRLSDRLNESQRGSQHIEDVTAVETTGNDDVIND
jgi:flagellar biosynthesis/type III secretory pathway protein FliH